MRVNNCENLNVGDEVIIISRYTKTLATVDEITSDGEFRVGGSSYDSAGDEIGGHPGYKIWIEPATPERKEEKRREDAIFEAKNLMRTCSPNHEQAFKIIDIFNNANQ